MREGNRNAIIVFVLLVVALIMQKQGFFGMAITGFEIYKTYGKSISFTCPEEYESCTLYRSSSSCSCTSCSSTATQLMNSCNSSQTCSWSNTNFCFAFSIYGNNPKLQALDIGSIVSNLFSSLWDAIRSLLGWSGTTTTVLPVTTTTVLNLSTTTITTVTTTTICTCEQYTSSSTCISHIGCTWIASSFACRCQ